MTIRRSGTPDSPMVIAFVTPTGEGEQPVQAINLHLTSYMNGQRIHRLLDFETTEPQKCESILYPTTSHGYHECFPLKNLRASKLTRDQGRSIIKSPNQPWTHLPNQLSARR